MEMVLQVDAAQAEAWRESDKMLISAAIEATVGYAPLNEMIKSRVLAFLQFQIETSDTMFFEAG